MVIFPPEVRPFPRLPAPESRRPAVFFDRDDTLIENGTLPAEAFAGKAGDLADPDWIRPLPHAFEACRRVAEMGFAVVIVTNQGVVARGGASLDEVEAACQRTLEIFEPHAQAMLACPFHPQGEGPPQFCREHAWRKPAPGMLLAAADLLGLDLSRSWMVGDAERDVQAGVAAGLESGRCLRVGDGGLDLASAIDRIAQASVVRGG